MKTKKLVLICFITIIFIVLLNNLFYVDFLEMLFYKTESTAVSYVYFNDVYINGSKLNIDDVLDDKTKSLKQVFCIDNGRIYFAYSYTVNDKTHYVLASINSDDSELKIIWDEVFDYMNSWECQFDYYVDYSSRNGYYYDGKIIVTDFDKLIEYDLKTEVCRIMKFYEYEQPIIDLEIKKNNSQEYLFSYNNSSFLINEDFFIENSEVANKILLKNKLSIWNGDSPTNCFIDSVKVVGEQVFVVCSIKNFSGTSYAIVFEINPEQQICNYVGFKIVGGVIHDSEFYIVPRIDNQRQSGDGSTIESENP
ncbi:MAG: hypothetical protein E7556_05420 [Ruminococcaceae bacterium]|nr:hypothetical protein [Oscillospiraceae bacterium]